MKTLLFFAVTVFLVLLISSVTIAQPGLPSAPGQAPIDGGLSLLALAGGGYALKKLRDRRKNEDPGL